MRENGRYAILRIEENKEDYAERYNEITRQTGGFV